LYIEYEMELSLDSFKLPRAGKKWTIVSIIADTAIPFNAPKTPPSTRFTSVKGADFFMKKLTTLAAMRIVKKGSKNAKNAPRHIATIGDKPSIFVLSIIPNVPEKSQADIIPAIQAAQKSKLTINPCIIPSIKKTAINIKTIMSMNMGVK